MEDQFLLLNPSQDGEISILDTRDGIVVEQGNYSVTIPEDHIANSQTQYIIQTPATGQSYIVPTSQDAMQSTLQQNVMLQAAPTPKQIYQDMQIVQNTQFVNQSVAVHPNSVASQVDQHIQQVQPEQQCVIQQHSQQIIPSQFVSIGTQSPQHLTIVQQGNNIQFVTPINIRGKDGQFISAQPQILADGRSIIYQTVQPQGNIVPSPRSAAVLQGTPGPRKVARVRPLAQQMRKQIAPNSVPCVRGPQPRHVRPVTQTHCSTAQNVPTQDGGSLMHPGTLRSVMTTASPVVHSVQVSGDSFNAASAMNDKQKCAVVSQPDVNVQSSVVTSSRPDSSGRQGGTYQEGVQQMPTVKGNKVTPMLAQQQRLLMSQKLAVSQENTNYRGPSAHVVPTSQSVSDKNVQKISLDQYRERQKDAAPVVQIDVNKTKQFQCQMVASNEKILIYRQDDNCFERKVVSHVTSQDQMQPASSVPVATSAKQPKSYQQNLVQGKGLLCKHCGIISQTAIRCSRCNNLMSKETKPLVREHKQCVKSASLTCSFPSLSVGIDSKTGAKRPVEKTPGSHPHNSRPPRGRGRGRGRCYEEPEILTLSSDEEEEKTKNGTTMTDSVKRISDKEPVITPDADMDPGYEDTFEFRTLDNGTLAGMLTEVVCRSIRIGSYKSMPNKTVILKPEGIRLMVPPVTCDEGTVTVDIPMYNIVKILSHFDPKMPLLFLYVKASAAVKIRKQLGMDSANGPYFDPCSNDESQKRITIIMENMTEQNKQSIKEFYGAKVMDCGTISCSSVGIMEQLSVKEANEILIKSSPVELPNAVKSTVKADSVEAKTLLIYPPPPQKGGISITTDDYCCLEEEQFLNDVIIDFYLKWIFHNILTEEQRKKTHIFSTFFYKRLTSKPKRGRKMTNSLEDDPKINPATKRHARVKSWTKNVDIFEKDFILIPINEHAHWFLAIICFCGLDGPVRLADGQPVERRPVPPSARRSTRPKTKVEEIPIIDGDWSDRDEAEGDDDELDDGLDEEEDNPTNKRQKEDSAISPVPKPKDFPLSTHGNEIKQPCILIFDSLSGARRSRIVATLRDYLSVEYFQRREVEKVFSRETMMGACPKVPQQMNFSDCGIFTLQYAENFFEVPLQDYTFPIPSLSKWFSQKTIGGKREALANLIKGLAEKYNPENIASLPVLQFAPPMAQETKASEGEEQKDTTADVAKTASETASKDSASVANFLPQKGEAMVFCGDSDSRVFESAITDVSNSKVSPSGEQSNGDANQKTTAFGLSALTSIPALCAADVVAQQNLTVESSVISTGGSSVSLQTPQGQGRQPSEGVSVVSSSEAPLVHKSTMAAALLGSPTRVDSSFMRSIENKFPNRVNHIVSLSNETCGPTRVDEDFLESLPRSSKFSTPNRSNVSTSGAVPSVVSTYNPSVYKPKPATSQQVAVTSFGSGVHTGSSHGRPLLTWRPTGVNQQAESPRLVVDNSARRKPLMIMQPHSRSQGEASVNAGHSEHSTPQGHGMSASQLPNQAEFTVMTQSVTYQKKAMPGNSPRYTCSSSPSFHVVQSSHPSKVTSQLLAVSGSSSAHKVAIVDSETKESLLVVHSTEADVQEIKKDEHPGIFQDLAPELDINSLDYSSCHLQKKSPPPPTSIAKMNATLEARPPHVLGNASSPRIGPPVAGILPAHTKTERRTSSGRTVAMPKRFLSEDEDEFSGRKRRERTYSRVREPQR